MQRSPGHGYPLGPSGLTRLLHAHGRTRKLIGIGAAGDRYQLGVDSALIEITDNIQWLFRHVRFESIFESIIVEEGRCSDLGGRLRIGLCSSGDITFPTSERESIIHRASRQGLLHELNSCRSSSRAIHRSTTGNATRD